MVVAPCLTLDGDYHKCRHYGCIIQDMHTQCHRSHFGGDRSDRMQAGLLPLCKGTSESPVSDVWSRALRGDWRADRVVGADQVLIVAVDGVDERRLIV